MRRRRDFQYENWPERNGRSEHPQEFYPRRLHDYSESDVPDAEHQHTERGRRRQRSRSPHPSRRVVCMKKSHHSRQIQERDNFSHNERLAMWNEDDHLRNGNMDYLPFSEFWDTRTTEVEAPALLERHHNERQKHKKRSRPDKKSDYLNGDRTTESLHSHDRYHQKTEELGTHATRIEIKDLAEDAWIQASYEQASCHRGNPRASDQYSGGTGEFSSEHASADRPCWWPETSVGGPMMEAQGSEMLLQWRSETDVLPPMQQEAQIFPNMSADVREGPRQMESRIAQETLDPRKLDAMSEEKKSDLAGEILYLLYCIFNGNVPSRTQSTSLPTEPFSGAPVQTCHPQNETSSVSMQKEELVSRQRCNEAITALELHREIMLNLGVSFLSEKVLCQFLEKYRKVFSVEYEVQTSTQAKNSLQTANDLEDGELLDKGDAVENQGENTDGMFEHSLIHAHFDLILCRQHSNKPDSCNPWDCLDLHICRHYLLSGFCKFQNCCKFQHRLGSEHNNTALQNRLLHRFPQDAVFELARSLKYRNDSTMPRLCTFYNNVRGDGCHNQQCAYLHVCRRHIEDKCLEWMKCSLNHDLAADQPKSVLSRFGLDFSESETDSIETVRSILAKISMDQKQSTDFFRSERVKQKRSKKPAAMACPAVVPNDVLRKGQTNAPRNGEQASYWVQDDQSALTGQWQMSSSPGDGSPGEQISWTDAKGQSELEERFQAFLRAARPCIVLDGQHLEVDFIAMSARVLGGGTLALRRKPLGADAESGFGSPSLQE